MADQGASLVLRLAVKVQIQPLRADQVSEAVRFRYGEMVGVDVDTDRAQFLPGNPFDGTRLDTNEETPAFRVPHETVTERRADALDHRFARLGLAVNALTAGQRRDDLRVTVGEAHPRQRQVLALRRQVVRKAQLQGQRARFGDRRLTGLIAGRLILAAEHKELARPGVLPSGLPFAGIGIAVGGKIELGAK